MTKRLMGLRWKQSGLPRMLSALEFLVPGNPSVPSMLGWLITLGWGRICGAVHSIRGVTGVDVCDKGGGVGWEKAKDLL